jgi:hypothetical protein
MVYEPLVRCNQDSSTRKVAGPYLLDSARKQQTRKGVKMKFEEMANIRIEHLSKHTTGHRKECEQFATELENAGIEDSAQQIAPGVANVGTGHSWPLLVMVKKIVYQ